VLRQAGGLAAGGEGVTTATEKLGRFGHHPDPVVDFCVEVDIIEGLIADVDAGIQEWETVADRVFKAMQSVWIDGRAQDAKNKLRLAEADLKKLEPGPKTVVRWALWCKEFGYYQRFPHDAEELYDTKKSAEAARLSGSHYQYRPVKVRLVPVVDR
jgi:hypothetical protein